MSLIFNSTSRGKSEKHLPLENKLAKITSLLKFTNTNVMNLVKAVNQLKL
jgi:hypothetical protein